MSLKIERRKRLLAKMAALPKAVRAEMHKALDKSADEMADVAQRFAPVDSGALKASIGYTFGAYTAENANVRGFGGAGDGDAELTVRVHAGNADAWYARLVEYGTAPHTITAKNAPVLAYSGRIVGKSVTHTGASAHPFFWPAYRITKKRAASRLRRATSKAANQVARSS